MTYKDIVFRQPEVQDREQWISLFIDYCTAVGANVPSADDLNYVFDNLLRSDQEFHGIFAYDQKAQKLIGFLQYITHLTSDGRRPRCYMEDAYVLPDYRGHGIFQAMYADLVRRGAQESWQKIYWVTEPDNVTAQNLYDKIAKRQDWVYYEHSFEERRNT